MLEVYLVAVTKPSTACDPLMIIKQKLESTSCPVGILSGFKETFMSATTFNVPVPKSRGDTSSSHMSGTNTSLTYRLCASHKQSFVHTFCLYSTYLDTLFCNLTFLQTFFSSLDAYLRLRNPTFYLASAKRRPALWLKVGSPWLVAAIQAIGQLALSDRQHVRLHQMSTVHAGAGLQTTCLLPDPNFLIIRTAIAYALPLLICIVLVGLQLRCLRNLRTYSSEAIDALLQVRKTFGRHTPPEPHIMRSSGINRNRLDTSRTETMYSSSIIPMKQTEQYTLLPLTLSSTQIIRPHSPQLMSSSWHVDRQYTLETLIPDCGKSMSQLGVHSDTSQIIPKESIGSHVIFSTGTMPVIELHSLNPSRPDGIQSSLYQCPTHGLINLAIDTASTLHPLEESGTSITAASNFWSHPNVLGDHTILRDEEINTESPLDTNILHQSTHQESTMSHDKPVLNSQQNAEHLPTSTAGSDKGDQLPLERSSVASVGDRLKGCEADMKPVIPLWLTAYQGEQLAVAINLVSCIIAVGTWSPYVLATLANGLCQPVHMGSSHSRSPTNHPFFPVVDAAVDMTNTKLVNRCLIQVTPDRIADFRWWAYASAGLLLPILLFYLDLGLRDGCWRALNYSDKSESTQSPTQSQNWNSIRSTTTVQTYRCKNARQTRDARETVNRNTEQEMKKLSHLWNKRASVEHIISDTVDMTGRQHVVPNISVKYVS
ncbi:hypothetical protein P879_05935 [Paragonimus westermani]|uniref:Uncharacterized protein n=1 Tax=Paragonimus westermani TaxID=34504 RepID=A0A8T0D8V1_9TREM|nr:hypothetical protein P879_05935 [Paragonimus westermani]